MPTIINLIENLKSDYVPTLYATQDFMNVGTKRTDIVGIKSRYHLQRNHQRNLSDALKSSPYRSSWQQNSKFHTGKSFRLQDLLLNKDTK